MNNVVTSVLALIGVQILDRAATTAAPPKQDVVVNPNTSAPTGDTPATLNPAKPAAVSIMPPAMVTTPLKRIPAIIRANPKVTKPAGLHAILAGVKNDDRPSGSVSTMNFKSLTDPANQGNAGIAPDYVLYDIRKGWLPKPVTAIPVRANGVSGAFLMMLAEQTGQPAETVNDPQTAPVNASLISGAPTNIPGVRPAINGTNPQQMNPQGAAWDPGVTYV